MGKLVSDATHMFMNFLLDEEQTCIGTVLFPCFCTCLHFRLLDGVIPGQLVSKSTGVYYYPFGMI